MAKVHYRLPFVLDSDCIIKLARTGWLRHVPTDDQTIIVPFKVDEELRRYRGRSLVRDWLRRNPHVIKRFQAIEEHRLYLELGIKSSWRLGEGERCAIAMAYRRGLTFVSDDKLAKETATSYGVVTMSPWEFRDLVAPRFRTME